MDKIKFISLYLQRPFQDSEWWKKIGIGALIGLVPAAINIIPHAHYAAVLAYFLAIFLYLGYILEWIESLYKDPETSEYVPLPEWRNPGKLAADGLVVSIIILIYCLLPLILSGIGNGAIDLGGVSRILGYIFKFLAGLGFVIVTFILPVSLIEFSAKKKIESAYKITLITETISGVFKEYLLSYLLGLGMVVAAWIIIAGLNVMLLGYIFIPALNFYTGLVIFYRFSKLLSGAKNKGEING